MSTDRARVHFLRGLDAVAREDWSAAIQEFESSLQYCPGRESTVSNLLCVLLQQGEFVKADALVGRALDEGISSPELLINAAALDMVMRRFDSALERCSKALSIDENLGRAWTLQADAYLELERFDAALNSYQRALALGAAAPELWCNQAVALIQVGRFEDALRSCELSIGLRPESPIVWNNRGVALKNLYRLDEAVECFDQALRCNDNLSEAWNNRAGVLVTLRHYEAAVESYQRALMIDPLAKFALSGLLHSQAKICSWNDFPTLVPRLHNGLTDGSLRALPFEVLGLIDSPELHQTVAKIYIDEEYGLCATPTSPLRVSTDTKIRVGYFSADFHQHAVTHLMVEVFETQQSHDFEFFAFSLGPAIEDNVQRELVKNFTAFFDVSSMTDAEVVELAGNLGIHIAVDLMGFTLGCRPGIFAARCAPIQINFLGFPGTMGSTAFDYIVADRTVISAVNRPYISESIIYLPTCYQPNSSKREISEVFSSRGQVGLPHDAVVFCCFNNSYKILPHVFDRWMRILGSVGNSVLWLLEDNPVAARNIRSAAHERGVLASRIVFAPRLPHKEHLSRHALADLFLDTLPYTAHTTASDSLFAGVPVLTCVGDSFPSRVATSIVRAFGLPELSVDTLEDYQNKAVALGTDREKLKELKNRVSALRSAATLFDGKTFSDNLKVAYRLALERSRLGLEPADIYVERT